MWLSISYCRAAAAGGASAAKLSHPPAHRRPPDSDLGGRRTGPDGAAWHVGAGRRVGRYRYADHGSGSSRLAAGQRLTKFSNQPARGGARHHGSRRAAIATADSTVNFGGRGRATGRPTGRDNGGHWADGGGWAGWHTAGVGRGRWQVSGPGPRALAAPWHRAGGAAKRPRSRREVPHLHPAVPCPACKAAARQR